MSTTMTRPTAHTDELTPLTKACHVAAIVLGTALLLGFFVRDDYGMLNLVAAMFALFSVVAAMLVLGPWTTPGWLVDRDARASEPAALTTVGVLLTAMPYVLPRDTGWAHVPQLAGFVLICYAGWRSLRAASPRP